MIAMETDGAQSSTDLNLSAKIQTKSAFKSFILAAAPTIPNRGPFHAEECQDLVVRHILASAAKIRSARMKTE
jgi:hypothetical protein